MQANLDKDSYWELESVEHPVEVQNRDTRIDIVLKRSRRIQWVDGAQFPFLIVGECKRANPSLSDWCFIKSPKFVRRWDEQEYLERAQLDESGTVRSAAWNRLAREDLFHVGLEVKTDKKGDPKGSGRGDIEDAATQVLRGLNGMVNHMATHQTLFQSESQVFLLPAIFTTARLWTWNAYLDDADLKTGEIDLEDRDYQEVSWLLYQYNSSPGLKHDHTRTIGGSSFYKIQESEFIRTIPVVGPEGIRPFLKWAQGMDFSM